MHYSDLIKLFLLIWIFVYVYSIIQNFLKLMELLDIIKLLRKYLSAAKPTSYGHLATKADYREHKSTLLFNYPKIRKYLTFHSGSLDYGYSDFELYENAGDIYTELLMIRNTQVSDLKQSFNPFGAIKYIFSFPSTALNWIGFMPNESSIKIINLLGWLIAYFLNLYSPEIKIFISTLFK